MVGRSGDHSRVAVVLRENKAIAKGAQHQKANVMRAHVVLLRLEAMCGRASPISPLGVLGVVVQLPENARKEAISPVNVRRRWVSVQ